MQKEDYWLISTSHIACSLMIAFFKVVAEVAALVAAVIGMVTALVVGMVTDVVVGMVTDVVR